MNISFWSEIQRCWRVTTSIEDKQLIQKTAAAVAEDWAAASITNPYRNNPLDDLEDEEDDEEY